MGYRRNSKRVKDVNGMQQILIDLKPFRCDSDVFINHKFDVTNLVRYVEEKKKEGEEITFFHTFVTAIGKILYNRRRLNYFVANRHLYEHNDVVVSFVAKVDFTDGSEEIMVMVPILPDDNLDSIRQKILNKVTDIRVNKKDKKGANSAIDVLGKLPNIIRVPLVGIFKWLDKKGILPDSLVEDNLYYSSIIVSNLGSIKCDSIYHNITDFGTCSSLATIGEIKDEKTLDGKIRKVCEFGVNFDERVADGYYFAKSIKLFQYIFDNPELLEDNVSEKIEKDKVK